MNAMRWCNVIFLALLFMVPAVSAQEELPPDQITIGEISAETPVAFFTFTAEAGQSIELEVIEVTPGLAPRFTIITQGGIFVTMADNNELVRGVETAFTAPESDGYLISIDSASDTNGQFVVRYSIAEPRLDSNALRIDEPVRGMLGLRERHLINLPPTETTLLLTLHLRGVSAQLRNEIGDVVGLIGTPLTGGEWMIPGGESNYVLELMGLITDENTFEVVLSRSEAPDNGDTGTNGDTGANDDGDTNGNDEFTLPELPESGSCVLATESDIGVNIRRGPDTTFDVVGALLPEDVATVVGRNSGSTWYEIRNASVRGWVASFVTRQGGDCSNIPVTYVPPTATPTPSPTFTPTPTLTPTATTTSSNTFTTFVPILTPPRIATFTRP